MIVLGLNAFHADAAACLIRDGCLVAAAEEERFRRIKHWAGFPSEAIRYCLAEAGVALANVDHVAINSDPSAGILRKIGYVLRRRPDPALILDRVRNRQRRGSLASALARAFPQSSFRGNVHRVEHHRAHLASAFLVSPFAAASVASIDGFGDFSSAAWGIGQGTDIEIEGRVHFPHSLGIFYQALTQYLGFPNYGDEYKVMGLAPYGRPDGVAAMRRIVRLAAGGAFTLDTTYFRHHREHVDYRWENAAPHVGTLFSPALEDLLGPARQADEPITDRHRDIARATQAMYEEAFFHLLDALHARHRMTSLALAGGCAMNSVANGKIARRTAFKQVYVQAAAGDAGGAIGAALDVWHRMAGTAARGPGPHRPPARCASATQTARLIMDHAYFGPASSDFEIAALLSARAEALAADRCHAAHEPDDGTLCRATAEAIARGDVVGWFQGRMEWGPRALGNRSILCDPRRADIKDILNRKIKRRESFRPFAPSILEEQTHDWFEVDGDVPFMTQVHQIREERRPLIPAVTHVDGSGRLQTVRKATNPRYWRLIDAFRKLTGVPMLLNTSLNENEPIVCTPAEALDCFLRTRMDRLVLGDHVVTRA